jgi:hypothetical protein
MGNGRRRAGNRTMLAREALVSLSELARFGFYMIALLVFAAALVWRCARDTKRATSVWFAVGPIALCTLVFALELLLGTSIARGLPVASR